MAFAGFDMEIFWISFLDQSSSYCVNTDFCKAEEGNFKWGSPPIPVSSSLQTLDLPRAFRRGKGKKVDNGLRRQRVWSFS